MDLYKVPSYLVIHLKRFKSSSHHAEKNTVRVNFPLKDLNLTDYVLNSTPPLTSNSMEEEEPNL
jgi:hypothetical protein